MCVQTHSRLLRASLPLSRSKTTIGIIIIIISQK